MHCDFASEAADLALVLVLGLTYCVIAPAMMPACAVYFGAASLIYRWLFLYVYTPDVDSAGAMWCDLFRGSTVGLFLGTLSLASLAAAERGMGSPECIAMVLLPAIVLLFLVYCNRNYDLPSQKLSLAEAAAADAEALMTGDKQVNLFRGDYYMDPVRREAGSLAPRDELFMCES